MRKVEFNEAKCLVPLLAILFFFILYSFLAFYAHPSDRKFVFDIVEGLLQFSIDDSYRFFETRSAWQNGSLWSWAYLLPMDALFKGVLHSITGSDIFLMRVAHFFVNLMGVFALYNSCLLLGVRKILALLVCLSLMLMPLFMVISMSFYGESLLGAMLAWAMYFFLSGQTRVLVLIASLIPLVHLQGLFLIIGYFFYFFLKRARLLFFLLALPGFLYFLYVMMIHGGVFGFLSSTQLHKLYPALPVPIQARGWQAGLETLNPALVTFSIIGAALHWKRVWPLYIGVVLWFLFVSTLKNYINGYEPRYLFTCLPAIFLTFALFLDRVWSLADHYGIGPKGWFIALSILLLLLMENLGQSDPIRAKYLGEQRWPIGKPHIGAHSFITINSMAEDHGNDMARRVEAFLTENNEYKLLVVNQHEIFYFLDRGNMPDDVRVVYTPFPPMLAYPAFDGTFHALSADHPQAAFYRFFRTSGAGKGKALFIGDFEPLGWQADYKNHQYSVYQLSYEFTDPPSRIYIIHRMGKGASGASYYKGRNLCADEEGVFCPDWRRGLRPHFLLD